jgi:hypothetical protein
VFAALEMKPKMISLFRFSVHVFGEVGTIKRGCRNDGASKGIRYERRNSIRLQSRGLIRKEEQVRFYSRCNLCMYDGRSAGAAVSERSRTKLLQSVRPDIRVSVIQLFAQVIVPPSYASIGMLFQGRSGHVVAAASQNVSFAVSTCSLKW